MKSTIVNLQSLLFKYGVYKGKSDGIFGPISEASLAVLLAMPNTPLKVEQVKAFQQILSSDGYYTSKVDGIFGGITRSALDKAISISTNQTAPMKQVGRPRLKTSRIVQKYGVPSAAGEYLVTIQLPYPMVIAWDTQHTVTRMRVHKLAAEAFTAVFNDLLAHYGLAKIKELGIDMFGGCFNFRKMRGGSEWSRHSWGIAIDLDPSRNTLSETSTTARFARPEYKPMIEIFAKHNFVSYGVLMNRDWMHFELAV